MTVIGGDTVARSGPLTLRLMGFGEVEISQALTSRGKRTSYHIYVSGTICDAARGLKVQKRELTSGINKDTGFLIDCYRSPQLRTVIWSYLGGIASAIIEISDGLAQVLDRVARQSDIKI